MKKLLLFASACLAASMAFAQSSELYVLVAPEDLTENGGPGFTYGTVNGISANGELAVICDEDNRLSYLWKKSEPNTMTRVYAPDDRGREIPTMLFDINNDGVMVGSQYLGDAKFRPTVYKDGVWDILDVPRTTLNSAYAFFVSEDSKYIGGYVMIKDESIETGSGYRPILWTLGEDGKYTYTIQIEIPKEVSGHQGFWPLRMSEDGSMIIGYMMLPPTQSTIPAVWYPFDSQYAFPGYQIEQRYEPWYYQDEIKGYDWETYINGYHDTDVDNNINGGFSCLDEEEGILYGYRTTINDVQEDGSATLKSGATSFSLTDDEYTDDFDNNVYYYFAGGKLYGAGRKGLFVIENGKQTNFNTYYGLTNNRSNIAGIQVTSADGKVVGGSTTDINPATGEPDYFPMIIVDGRTGVDAVAAADTDVEISVANGVISVKGAEAEVYSINGQLVARGNAAVAPGLYIVKAGSRVEKVLVK